MSVETQTDRQKDQQRAANRARNRAYRELARRHPEDFHAIYSVEALREGIIPNRMRGQVAASLSQVAESGIEGVQ